MPEYKVKKILIVDDSVVDRQASIKVLKERRCVCEILEASNGEEALEIISKHYKDIGLILLDWQMPKMDGMELMKALVHIPATASIPIIMVTASGSEEAKSSVRRVNPKLAGYVVKPFQAEELVYLISTYVKFLH
jgi:two-component system chemotaxis response regulator CheY